MSNPNPAATETQTTGAPPEGQPAANAQSGGEDLTGLKSALEKERTERKNLEKLVADLTKRFDGSSTEQPKTAETAGNPATETKHEGATAPEYKAILNRFLKDDLTKVFGEFQWAEGFTPEHAIPDVSKFAKDGVLDTEAAKAYLTEFRDKNAFARPAANPATGGSSSGQGDPAVPGKLSRSDIERLSREGKHEEILKAHREGRILAS